MTALNLRSVVRRPDADTRCGRTAEPDKKCNRLWLSAGQTVRGISREVTMKSTQQVNKLLQLINGISGELFFDPSVPTDVGGNGIVGDCSRHRSSSSGLYKAELPPERLCRKQYKP